MGRFVLKEDGQFWWVEDPADEIQIIPYERRPPEPDDFSWWKDPYPDRPDPEIRRPDHLLDNLMPEEEGRG